MKPTRLAATSLAAIATFITLGCKVPLLPKWSADEKIPLASQKITLVPPFTAGVPVPGGTSQPVSFSPQSQTIDGLIGQLLKSGLDAASIVSVVTKSVAVSAADTLFIAADSVSLSNAAAQRIVVPLTIVAANAKDSALTQLTGTNAAGLTMLQNVAIAGGSLWVQMRGRATCPNPGPCTFTTSDSVGIKLTLLATVPISR